MTTIASNMQAVNRAIEQAAHTAQRRPETIALLAVSKTFSAAAIRAAYDAGQHAFGESYLQEALGKIEALRGLPLEWHFIGPIQSNKTRAIAENFAWVHGIDRLKIAERLSAQRPPGLPPLNVCIQVNVSGEDSKGGVPAADATALAQAVARLPRLRLRGLMAIPAPATGVAAQRRPFARLRELLRQISARGLALDTLSMGMSDDLEAAVLEGATIVRVGSAIFGKRDYGKKQMNICFIGGGNMASALIGGLLKQGMSPLQLRAVEINADNRTRLQQEFGVLATAELPDGVAGSDAIVLAVKPQQLHEVSAQLAPLLSGQLLISIAAGIRAGDLARWLGAQNVVRAMPNTPALIQSGITGLYALPAVSAAQREAARQILAAVGSVLWLEDEAMMDAVTAVSGSGPAYVFLFIEALQQAARELGFNAEDARSLALDTFLGAARLAEASPDDVSLLRARVTSKNGTTERALLSMEAHQVKQHIVAAVHAAAARAKEMGDELGAAS